MTVFQVKGQSHRLSTLKGKEKDVIKNFFYILHQVTKDTEALGRQLSQARSKPDPVETCQKILLRTTVTLIVTVIMKSNVLGQISVCLKINV